MENKLYHAETFQQARDLMVGPCNGLSTDARWEGETAPFARAILAHIQPSDRTVLDYGAGVGRLAKELLAANQVIRVLGVDDSPSMLTLAKAYVNSERFVPLAPHELRQSVDLAYMVYVLQVIPAVALREVLQSIHYYLRPGGKFICCSSDFRMALRSDGPGLYDDRDLGVDLRAEVERLFEPTGPLFGAAELQQHEVVRRMIDGTNPAGPGIAHPALVYTRREVNGPYFNVPFAKR